MSSQKYPINKPLRAAGIGYFVLFLLLVITKSILPYLDVGWRNPPALDYILVVGIGTCISVIGITYSYYSWTLDKKLHKEWLISQGLINPKWTSSWFENYSDAWSLWLMRLVSPILALIGLLPIGFMLFSITKLIF